MGQLAGLVARLARKARILLILNSSAEAAYLRQALAGQGIYLPRGTLVAQMERLSESGCGLAIGYEKQLAGWVLRAQAHNLKQPFDSVIVETWPIDAPELVAPPTRGELKVLRRELGQDSEESTETDEDVLLDDDELGQRPDEDLVLSSEGSRAYWAGLLRQRLYERSDGLAPLVWGAERLSGESLLVLDPRLAVERIKDVGDLPVRPVKIEFDQAIAKRVQEELSDQVGPRWRQRLQGDGVPPVEEWNDLARHLFGLPGDLHGWQKSYLQEIMLEGHRTLTIESPTGSGKSLMFQFPALVQGMQTGLLTLVISPLRALMHEQCEKLWQLGFVFNVEAVSSDLAPEEVDEVYQRLADGQLQLLFVAPERFRSRRFVRALQQRLRRDQRLQYWVFDEAHCISLWGHEFRPDYFHAAREVRHLRDLGLERKAAILLLSATLPDRVVEQLEEIFESGDTSS